VDQSLDFGLETLRGKVERAQTNILAELKELKGGRSHWTGKLSNSALSTATAISALSVVLKNANTSHRGRADLGLALDELKIQELIGRGSRWLADVQNSDGGFGDTDRSLSNIATTLLVIAAWKLASDKAVGTDAIQRAWAYVDQQGGWDGLRNRYGKDKTFVVPIMTNCAIAGLIDWHTIPTLPFEAAALPQSWYRFAKMPVVSYAVPALVAIGQAQFVHSPPTNRLIRTLRHCSRRRTLRVLSEMQPTSGGYLEATPLTSFVLMSLASIGLGDTSVARRALRFLIDSVLPDGSWPIDTNLATWVTSLAMKHYYPTDRIDLGNNRSDPIEWERSVDWLLSCQHRLRHPFTGAEPGGWGWTNLSGSVPDADDTPAALLALANYREANGRSSSYLREMRLREVIASAELGCQWLLRLQNRDGGWPTFCKGWGTLPFDRSGSDLTAHALRALNRWRPHLKSELAGRIDRACFKGWKYLSAHQQPDGNWLPLWFGNQDRPAEDNPVYGTSRVLLAYGECGRAESTEAQRGIDYLKKSQNRDGGWGGGPSIRYEPSTENGHANGLKGKNGENFASSTIEETAVALEGIMACGGEGVATDSIMRGLGWLCDSVEQGHYRTSQPIGFYFAKLWYHEQYYPLVFALGALKKGLQFCQR
jgi:squalene-hopene/tetraprenyl-beta-curcumene cyclase